MANTSDVPESALDSIRFFIDNKKSFCFDSGAGSGKTFTLVRTINYILSAHGNELEMHNQRIMVITYTNAATNEIIERVGNTGFLDVSTIHTRLWELIKSFQEQLVQIHLENIEEQADAFKNLFEGDPYYQDKKLIASIKDKDSTFKEEFYKHKNMNATEFKELFKTYTSDNISNVTKFKIFVKNAFEYQKLTDAASKIRNGEHSYTKVEYDPIYNYDRLHRMKFSHDTLIKYSLKLIQSSKTLQRIIIDRYPFILVDEYQDTAPDVVRILAIVDAASNRAMTDKCVIGYYGDRCQNIYDSGVGLKIYDLHPGLERVVNDVNRRSLPEIVNIANKVRHDDVIQIPLQQDKHGSISVSYSTTDGVFDSFIQKSIKEFPSSEKVDCLILKNKIVAERMGFGSFYDRLARSSYYKTRYNQISTEVLSDDITKLGKVPLFFYRWLKFYSALTAPAGEVIQYIPRNVYSQLNLSQLMDIYRRMVSIKHENIDKFADGMKVLSEQDPLIEAILTYNVGKDFLLNSDGIVNFIFDNLYGGINDKDIPEGLDNATAIANSDLNVLLEWYSYITSNSDRRVRYHTFHGTKGLEFDNVIIVLTNTFNKKRDYFHSYFKDLSDDSKTSGEKFLERRNLLYVAITRAKKNLRILYVDPRYEDVKENFEKLFGNVEEFRAE